MKDLKGRGAGRREEVDGKRGSEGNKTSFGVPRTHHKQRRQKVAGTRGCRRRGRGSRTISPGSQSKNSEHIFSSLESGPDSSIGRRVESPSVGPWSSFFLYLLPPLSLSLSPCYLSLALFLGLSLSPRPSLDLFYLFAAFPLRSKHADTSSSVRGVSSEMKGGNRRLLGGSRGEGR